MISLASLSMKGLTGHHSKYGGNRPDIFESQHEEFDHWYCQSCSREMTKEIAPYFAEFPEGEYIRVCGVCINNDLILIETRTIEITEFTIENPYLVLLK